eukprot:TRINITY_DN7263_c0_g1_i2.p2 TRINITY_DN7263_c0_g1~~TRINITY_DN7263_c0_g1_i2.p2  ORF type:complete len:171 (-),score=23.78 TRINITY_DN7263_c0_g1_i2:711-1190(-)
MKHFFSKAKPKRVCLQQNEDEVMKVSLLSELVVGGWPEYRLLACDWNRDDSAAIGTDTELYTTPSFLVVGLSPHSHNRPVVAIFSTTETWSFVCHAFGLQTLPAGFACVLVRTQGTAKQFATLIVDPWDYCPGACRASRTGVHLPATDRVASLPLGLLC